MSKQFGYGPRAMNPANLNKRNADLNPSGQNPDLITDLEAAFSSRSPDGYAGLIAIAPNIFDSYAGFVAAADDLVANYGTGGGIAEADIASAFKTWLQANGGGGFVSTIEATWPTAFTTNALMRAAFTELIGGWGYFMTQWAAMLSAYPTTTQGAFPRVITPHVKTTNLTQDYTDMNEWMNALAIPGYGGIQINAAP